VLAHEVYDAPPAIPLLDMGHRKRGDLGPAQGAAEQHGDDGAVAQPLERRDVRRVQERLGLPERKPVSGAHADGLRALHVRSRRPGSGASSPLSAAATRSAISVQGARA